MLQAALGPTALAATGTHKDGTPFHNTSSYIPHFGRVTKLFYAPISLSVGTSVTHTVQTVSKVLGTSQCSCFWKGGQPPRRNLNSRQTHKRGGGRKKISNEVYFYFSSLVGLICHVFRSWSPALTETIVLEFSSLFYEALTSGFSLSLKMSGNPLDPSLFWKTLLSSDYSLTILWGSPTKPFRLIMEERAF